jgi:hypothetical protein
MHVLVIANDSVLTDAIVSTLGEENDLDVLRATRYESEKVAQAVREHCPVVIVVEEGSSEEKMFMTGNLFNGYDHLRILVVSPEQSRVRICESYHVPISRMEQMVNLVRGSEEFKQKG